MQHCIPMWKDAAKDVRAWRDVCDDSSAAECFLNMRGGPMTRSGFEYALRKNVVKPTEKYPSLAA